MRANERILGRLVLALGAGGMLAMAALAFLGSGGPRELGVESRRSDGSGRSRASNVGETVRQDIRDPVPGEGETQEDSRIRRLHEAFMDRYDARLAARAYSFKFEGPKVLQDTLWTFSSAKPPPSPEEWRRFLEDLLVRPEMSMVHAEIYLRLADSVGISNREEYDRLLRLAASCGSTPTHHVERDLFSQESHQLATNCFLFEYKAWHEQARAYFDSIDEYKLEFPERWEGVALYHAGGHMAFNSSPEDLQHKASYLEELVAVQPHASYLERDKQFLSRRLEATPFFSLGRDRYYYLRTEDYAALDLAEYHARQKDFGAAVAVASRLAAKYAELPLPNVGLLRRLGEYQFETGDLAGARESVRRARETVARVKNSDAMKAYELEPWEREVEASQYVWPHASIEGSSRGVEDLEQKLSRHP